MIEEFKTSISEMNRRKIAFRTLAVSLFISTSLPFIIIYSSYLQILIQIILIFAIILVIFERIFSCIFDKSKDITIILTEKEIERKGRKSLDKCKTSNIKKVNIKRNVKNLIREIKLDLFDSSSLYINGINKFEIFKESLLNTLKGSITINQIKEPIDYDHPLFYVFFGTLVGIIINIMLQSLSKINDNYFKYFQIAIAFFIIPVGLYFMSSKPIAGTYSKRVKFIDYIIGILIIFAGIYLVVISGIF